MGGTDSTQQVFILACVGVSRCPHLGLIIGPAVADQNRLVTGAIEIVGEYTGRDLIPAGGGGVSITAAAIGPPPVQTRLPSFLCSVIVVFPTNTRLRESRIPPHPLLVGDLVRGHDIGERQREGLSWLKCNHDTFYAFVCWLARTCNNVRVEIYKGATRTIDLDVLSAGYDSQARGRHPVLAPRTEFVIPYLHKNTAHRDISQGVDGGGEDRKCQCHRHPKRVLMGRIFIIFPSWMCPLP